MENICLKAHAKVNLSLRITAKRADGYHEIVSFMQGTGLHDIVELKKCSLNATKYNLPHCTINGIVVYLCTDAKTIPTDMSNLVFKGIKALTDACPDADYPDAFIVHIEKMLPVAAGLAGGSGNAAVCMLGLNALAGYPLDMRALMAAGVSAGADVPFSIFMNAYRNRSELAELDGIEEAADSAWTAGIGEIVESAEPVARYAVMANPGTSVSTQAAYEAMDRIGYSDAAEDARLMFVNDMEAYTLAEQPETTALKDFMMTALGANEVLMSGSGPTMVAYYTDKNKAEKGFAALEEYRKSNEAVRVWRTDTGI